MAPKDICCGVGQPRIESYGETSFPLQCGQRWRTTTSEVVLDQTDVTRLVMRLQRIVLSLGWVVLYALTVS